MILAPCLIVTACASSGAPAQPGVAAPEPVATPGAAATADAAHQHAEPLPATAGPGFTEADVRFMQHMIGHHAQALTMAAMAPTHGAGPRLLMLARKIDISQRDEIDMMRAWLIERDQAVPDEHQVHAMHMPGMLTALQLARLDAARGREFERLFLTLMIQHHEGALQMVDALFASPGAAQDSDIFRFVTDVGADQLDEIDQMRYLLNTLDQSGSESR